MFNSIQQVKQFLILYVFVLFSAALHAQETVYIPTAKKVSKDIKTIGTKADNLKILDYTFGADQEEIDVQISSYVDEYTLTGWEAYNPSCQTPNNICQKVEIESLLIKMTLKAKLIRKENEKYFYTSIDASGEIKFKGKATKYWPFSEVYSFDITRSYSISGGAGLIVYSSDLRHITRIDMNLPFGSSYPRIYKLLQGYSNIDTLSIRADLPSGWVFTYPYDLYQVYPAEVIGESCSDLTASFSYQHEPLSLPGEPIMFWRFVFSNTSTGQPESYEWDFGDGTTSTEKDPIHIFADGCANEYTVRLRVKKGLLCIKESNQTINTTSSQECPKPIALIAYTSGTPPASELTDIVSKELEKKGWQPIMRRKFNDIVVELKNPCVNGLYVISHGGVKNDDGVIVWKGETEDDKGYLSPKGLGELTSGRPLKFVTVIACLQDASAWLDAFNLDPNNLKLPVLYFDKLAYLSDQVLAAKLLKHGFNYKACSGDKNQYELQNHSTNFNTLKKDSSCSSFLICEGEKCGNELYPVYSCSTTEGRPINGQFSVSSSDGMFRVALNLPSSYEDSVGISATYFSDVPISLKFNGAIAIGRHLFFKNINADSTFSADSLTIEMNYLQSDILSVGLTDETKLEIYWITDDSLGHRMIQSTIDTARNSIIFTVPRWGLAGIYAPDSPTSINEHANDHSESKGFQLVQNFPNPFNSNTIIKYQLSRASRVKLRIFDINGQLVNTLLDQKQPQGEYEVPWNGKDHLERNVASGIYFYQIETEQFVQIKKLVLVK